jgi:hypothetical protein
MPKLLLILILAAAPSWAINCSGFMVDEVTPHSVAVHLTTDTTLFYEKLRYGTVSLTENTQGTGDNAAGTPAGDPVRQMVTGLSPSTTYLIGFSVSADNVTYCTELTTSITTPPEDAGILPMAPVDWNTNTVKTPCGTVRNVTSCSTLDAALKAATHTAGTACGDTVALANNLSCHVSTDAPDGVWHFNVNGQVGAWIDGWTAQVSPASTLTLTAHGLSTGNFVYIGSHHYNYTTIPTPLAWNHGYYIVNATANTIQLSLTNGGSAIPLTTAPGEILVSVGQPCVSEVLVTTQGALGTFPPEGVRTDDTHYSYATLTNDYLFGGVNRAFDLSWGSASCVRFDNIRFVNDNKASATDPDPPFGPYFFQTTSGAANHDVIFDRIVAKGANDAPNRTSGFIYPFDGARMAIINSYSTNLSYWVPFTDSPTSFTSSVFTVGAGFAYRGAAGSPCALSATATITGGSTTGAFFAYVNPTTCATHILTDPSLTVACSGCTQDTASAPSNYPLSGTGKFVNIAIGFGTLSSGTFTAFTNANNYAGGGCCFGQQANGNEASAALVGFDKGPGPSKIENNTLLNDIGIPIYWTGQTYDSGGSSDDPTVPLLDQPGNVIIRRNTIAIDNSHISSQPGFNGKGVWGGRNALEFKWVLKALVTGNVVNNLPRTNIQVGSAFLYTPASSTDLTRSTATTVQDVETSYNTVNNSSQGYLITSSSPSPHFAGLPSRRFWFHDNIFTMNGNVKFTTQSAGGGDFGILEGGYDIRFDHNTITALIGASGLLWNVAFFRFGNLNISNNLTFINNTNGWQGLKYSDPTPTNPVFNGLQAKAALDAGVGTSGPVAPNYVFAGNAFLCGYLDSLALTEMAQSDCNGVRAAYGTLTTSGYWTSGSTLAARLAAMKFYNYTIVGKPVDLHLNYHSPFISGAGTSTDGLDIGANIDALNAAQGQVANVRVGSVTSTSAIVSFLAPDSFACTVDWSTNGTLASFTRVANAGSGRIQTVTLSGLPSGSVVFYRVNCAAQQPTAGFRTH